MPKLRTDSWTLQPKLNPDMRTTDFHYELPPELIASRPLVDRESSRMMLVNRATSEISHHRFSDFPDLLPPDHLLVLNDTKVIPARLFSNDGKVELVRTDAPDPNHWWCLVRPGKKMRDGRSVEVGKSIGTVIQTNHKGERLIKWGHASRSRSARPSCPPPLYGARTR